MEELNRKLDGFYSFRTLMFVVFAVMYNALSEFYDYIKK